LKDKGQINIEFLLALAAYIALITAMIQVHSQNYFEIRERKENIEKYGEISRTSEICSYKYFHGPSIQIKGNYSSPTETDQNILIKELEDSKVKSKSFSPRISSSQDRITCEAIKNWYLTTS